MSRNVYTEWKRKLKENKSQNGERHVVIQYMPKGVSNRQSKVYRNSEAMRKLFNKNTLCLIVIEQSGQNHDK